MAHSHILQLPDFSWGNILQTDACNEKIGADLLQENDEGFKHPVVFISMKFLTREVRYATIERVSNYCLVHNEISKVSVLSTFRIGDRSSTFSLSG